MPSFYSRSAARNQQPLTPPEYLHPYSSSGHVTMVYPLAPFHALSRADHRSSANFSQSGWSYSREDSSQIYSSHLANDGYGELAPLILPPPASISRPSMYEQAVAGELSFPPRHHSSLTKELAPTKPEKSVGGVSAILDYHMDIMTDFVTEMAHGMYALFSQKFLCISDIDIMRSVQPTVNYSQSPDVAFRKWVHQLLCATRPPSATILLSLQILAMRMRQLSRNDDRQQPQYQRQRMLTVSLILGSKFLDDNTFINRSWSEVSGVEVKILNYMELDWFVAMDHRLHRDPNEAQGFAEWLDHWKNFERSAVALKANRVKLSPIDTTVQFQKNVRPTYSSLFHSQPKHNYGPPREPLCLLDTPTSYSSYDSTWFYPPSATDGSPTSAPHTGPTTPEYFALAGPGPAAWSASEGYSRRTMFGFPPSQSSVPTSSQPHSGHLAMSATLTAPVQEPAFSYVPNYNGDNDCCDCYQCYSPPRSYFGGYQSQQRTLPVPE